MIISSLLTIVLLVIFILYIRDRYGLLYEFRSSCGLDIDCQPLYDLDVSGIPIGTPLCKDSVECKLELTEESASLDIDLSTLIGDFAVPDPACVKIADRQVCCNGEIGKCLLLTFGITQPRIDLGASEGDLSVSQIVNAAMSGEFLNNSIETTHGYSVAFNSKMCRALPSCFIENDSSPYLLFPIPEFSINIYNKDLESLGYEHAAFNTPVGVGFGALGAMPLLPNQGAIYLIELPAYDDIAYFSLQPYLFQTGRPEWVNNYPQDLPFASLTDSFNLHILKEMAPTNQSVRDWIDGSPSLSIIAITALTKEVVDSVYSKIQNTPGLSDLPFVCLPVPAGSTYGDSLGPDDQPMLRENRFNKYNFNDGTLLFDWKRDTLGIVGRIAPADDPENFETWKSDFSSQYKSVVLGVTVPKQQSYNFFKLKDQNGYYDENGNWTQRGGDGYTLDNWRIQKVYENQELLDTVEESEVAIVNFMKSKGYTHRTIDINSTPSPFPYFNKHVESKFADDVESYKWNQSGMSMLQYNVAAFGDCRDTLYPTSNTFCLGKRDILVIVGRDYAHSSVDTPFAYNNLNIYDAQSQTSLASLRGEGGGVYALAAGRMDHTCMFDDLPDSNPIKSFQFIPTASHSELGASPTTSFFTQSRFYMDKMTGTSPLLDADHQKFTVFVFRPCDGTTPIYPQICHDYEPGLCYANPYPETQPCDLDLEVKANKQSERSDNITAGLCSKFRLNKTGRVSELTTIYAVLISVFIAGIIYGVVHSLMTKNPGDTMMDVCKTVIDYFIPFTAPFLGAVIAIMYISFVIAQTQIQSGYEINEAVKQS
jgi:hypothetical protein